MGAIVTFGDPDWFSEQNLRKRQSLVAEVEAPACDLAGLADPAFAVERVRSRRGRPEGGRRRGVRSAGTFRCARGATAVTPCAVLLKRGDEGSVDGPARRLGVLLVPRQEAVRHADGLRAALVAVGHRESLAAAMRR